MLYVCVSRFFKYYFMIKSVLKLFNSVPKERKTLKVNMGIELEQLLIKSYIKHFL